MKLFAPFIATLFLSACCASSPTPAPTPETPVNPTPVEPTPEPDGGRVDAIRGAIDAPDRSDADRALDEGRQPYALLALIGVRPGMHVAEIAAGGGYTSELLARIVGEQGSVVGQNTPFILEKFAEKPWSERLQKPVMKNVRRVDTEMGAPLPADVRNLDVVVNHLFYHDSVWMGTDRLAMNKNIFDALKSGGVYAIIDHSAAAGHGVADAQTLHRIEESVVLQEVTAAGFVLKTQSDILRHAADTRDWSTSPSAAGEKRGTSDRFVLIFTKP